MKKSVIFLTILLIASIAGTYAVYELYVKDKMKALGEHSAQVTQLETRLNVLQTTFQTTQPQVVVDQWRVATQPWAEAVVNRSRFFTLGSLVEPVEIPEEVIPKLYYATELPKRIQRLEDYADEKQVRIGDSGCGVPPANSYGEGTNPKHAEIRVHLETYDYCAALTRMVIDAAPISVEPLRIWPEEKIDTRSGSIKKRVTGISMKTSTEPLIRFLDRLSQSERFFKVDELRVSNSDLLNPTPVLTVEMVLSQAMFEPTRKAAAAGQAGGAAAMEDDRVTALFAGQLRAPRPKEEEVKRTWWQQFRRKWLPF